MVWRCRWRSYHPDGVVHNRGFLFETEKKMRERCRWRSDHAGGGVHNKVSLCETEKKMREGDGGWEDRRSEGEGKKKEKDSGERVSELFERRDETVFLFYKY